MSARGGAALSQLSRTEPQLHDHDAQPKANRPHVPHFRDATTFNNQTEVPTEGQFAYTVNNHGNMIATLISDCRPHTRPDLSPDEPSGTDGTPPATSGDESHPFSHPRGEETNIVDAIARMMDMPVERARFLVHIGAVYLSAFPDARAVSQAEKMPQPQRELMESSRQFMTYVIGKNSRSRKFDRDMRVMDTNAIVKTGNCITVSLTPRRSLLAAAMEASDWRRLVLYEDDSCVVVDKPTGIPAMPTPHNIRENVTVAVGQMLGYEFAPRQLYSVDELAKSMTSAATAQRCAKEVLPYIPKQNPRGTNATSALTQGPEPQRKGTLNPTLRSNRTRNREVVAPEPRPDSLMYVVQRLDVGTSGCMILAKTKHAAKTLQETLAGENARKVYTALCFSFTNPTAAAVADGTPPIPIGEHTHYLDVSAPCLDSKSQSRVIRTRAFDSPGDGRKESCLEVLNVQPVPLASVDVDADDAAGCDGVQLWEVEIELKTGRKHQIRAQLERFGLCCVGDEMYPHLLWGELEGQMDGQLGLQASKLELFGWEGEPRRTFVAGPPWWRVGSGMEDVARMVNAQLTGIRSRREEQRPEEEEIVESS
jgi:23S rRNA-/tRNA-specific pseudouridylate synthase